MTMSRDDPPDPPTRASHGAGPSASTSCFKCHEPPAAGTKLRVCAKCLHTSYCNADCQRADWASHKLDCTALGEMHQSGLAIAAAHKAAGRPKRDGNGLWEWYEEACPGLAKAVELVAWRHRRESPVILVQSCSDGTDASAPSLKMMPRSKWENGTLLEDGGLETLRTLFDRAGFNAEGSYMVLLDTHHPAGKGGVSTESASIARASVFAFTPKVSHAPISVECLFSMTLPFGLGSLASTNNGIVFHARRCNDGPDNRSSRLGPLTRERAAHRAPRRRATQRPGRRHPRRGPGQR